MATSRFVLDDRLPITEWQRRRNLQSGGRTDGAGEGVRAILSDDQPMDEWMWVRDQQSHGPTPTQRGVGAVRMASLSAARQPTEVDPVMVGGREPAPVQPPEPRRAPLTGRPGKAALVAGALNTITSGPNTSAPLPVPGGAISRGPGNDVHGRAKVFGKALSADATLDPPTGRAEISVSGVRGGKGLRLPERIRVFTTPTGELNIELPDEIKIGPVPVAKRGTYIIGTADPPKPGRKSGT